MKPEHVEKPFSQRLLELISEPNFIKFQNILSEPNFFTVVGRTHYERWHSNFYGWLLDANGSHLMRDYVLIRFLLLIHDERCLKSSYHGKNNLSEIIPMAEFDEISVIPNEHQSSEKSIRNVGRFDVFLTAKYRNNDVAGKLNVIFELKIDSRIDAEQSKKYANWLYEQHPEDTNILIYLLPELMSDSRSTVGDARWYCMDYQLLNDKLVQPILEHPNLNHKVQPFIIQYIKNLKIRHKGIKMAITKEEKKLAVELYEKYSDVFDSIFDALQEENIIDDSTSDIPTRGRSSGRITVKINNKIFDGETVRLLFRKILEYLVDENLLRDISLPWGISKTRYILTKEIHPIHPSGKSFFYPESYKGYTMETHYARERGLSC
ncbi:MAG: PD-(D/E)XK nuclease family protein [Anaerolineales bacterium]|uniref:PD-(D/E)XK nuclease family protein n=1 Tax=Candidatus Desulfolinea nitratireducens TaxID=2841698 RepID=A0A8J6NHY2_9CHLR|nr:PD-(D/E)XK nuclease family protein [Candidatus Desulfolinea nitratireducens]MBL6960731.1 PD-(D/E)XK nuclease family protein [Anaerolineales bacterium]